jgi:hypothetical protein
LTGALKILWLISKAFVSVPFYSESDYQHGCSVEEPEAPGSFALVINGHSLVHALHHKLDKLFLEIASQCKYTLPEFCSNAKT